MGNITKQAIIDEIRKAAKENGGVPLGRRRFEKDTGIKDYDFGRYWSKYSDALNEAGFEKNELQSAYSDEFLIEKLIVLVRKLGKFPTYKEINLEHHNNPEFPDKNTYQHRGSKEQLAAIILQFCENKSMYEDVVGFCEAILTEKAVSENEAENVPTESIGEVYLFKSGRYYKSGKTNDTVRRGTELRIQLPEKMDLVHSIKTDDPSGVEAYWHRRFESKRMNGEWFD